MRHAVSTSKTWGLRSKDFLGFLFCLVWLGFLQFGRTCFHKEFVPEMTSPGIFKLTYRQCLGKVLVISSACIRICEAGLSPGLGSILSC